MQKAEKPVERRNDEKRFSLGSISSVNNQSLRKREKVDEEIWISILEFPDYEISNLGRVSNIKHGHIMKTSFSNHGHVKITLKSDWSDERFTRSVALLVAEAFVNKPNRLCDNLIILDGDFSNVSADNLAWRPRWHAWKYTRQLKERQPIYYHNLFVYNETTDTEYSSIIEAGIIEGVLFYDIWRSTYTGEPVFPQGYTFKIIERV